MKASRRNAVTTLLRKKQLGLCRYCNQPMTAWKHKPHKTPPDTAETIEHLKRQQDGGTDRLDNLALACRACNEGRGSVDWFTYKTYRSGELWCEEIAA